MGQTMAKLRPGAHPCSFMCPVVQNDIRDHKVMTSLDSPYFRSSIMSSSHASCLIFWPKKMEVTEQGAARGAGTLIQDCPGHLEFQNFS